MAELAPDLPPLRDVIRRFDLGARKALGQNFLLDLNLTRRIARAAAPLEDANVVEIGPGPGGLTRALLMEGARHVTAIERDPRCVAALAADFGIEQPMLAVAALNPHAGEEGALGREEIEIIAPAVEALRRAGIRAEGPLPDDTLFHAAARRRSDAVLCMYHDQALIPIKTIDFAGGVNVTLGLPFVRTSPDHGTALDIAGTGRADPASLVAALDLADDMARRRHT